MTTTTDTCIADYANAYRKLLGPGWRTDGQLVTNGQVVIDVRQNTVTWPDLDGDQRTLTLPTGVTIGALVDLAAALAGTASRERRCPEHDCGEPLDSIERGLVGHCGVQCAG